MSDTANYTMYNIIKMQQLLDVIYRVDPRSQEWAENFQDTWIVDVGRVLDQLPELEYEEQWQSF